MNFNAIANLAHNGRVARRCPRTSRARRRGRGFPLLICLASVLSAGVVFAPGAPASDTPPQSTTPGAAEAPVPPPTQPPEIQPQILHAAPAPGKGRLDLLIDGNRRWCTYPDDRIVRPPLKPGTPVRRNEVFTFGYQFTVAAVKRGQADTPLMLYESPIFRTASWIPAFKLGQGSQAHKGGHARPFTVADPDAVPKPAEGPMGPDTLVPFWHEPYRCVTMPDRMEFDLEPGTYDIYMAFDLLGREGTWAHRTSAYLTDVRVESARRTRLDGLINLSGGSDRQAELRGSSMEPEATASPAAPGP